MKNIALILVCLCTIYSCTDSKKDKNASNGDAMAQSVGRVNELSVVIDSDLWKGAVGDTIREYFGAEVPGLPQEEPLFSMRQIPPEAFSGFARKNRTFLKIETGKQTGTTYIKNKYATPQLGAIISGNTNQEVISEVKKNYETIISKLKNIEMLETQNRIRKSLEKLPTLSEKMGITLEVPSAYRIAKEEDNFFWLRKDIKNEVGSGDMNLIVYELPLNTISKDSNTIASIIKIRDSIGAMKIPTTTGKFITEAAYAPYLFETSLDNKFAFETKGTWEIKDRFMAGPFVNYIIEDKPNNRLLVLEGFVFAPTARKRDNMFELEAIMKSVKFQ